MTTASVTAVSAGSLAGRDILHSSASRTGTQAVTVDALRKRYGAIEAVAGLSFEIRPGEIFGLLGPNGAGKTTTISVVATRLLPTSGQVTVLGHALPGDAAAVRQMIGVVTQDISLYPKLTAAENIRFFARMYGVSAARLRHRTAELLELVGLAPRGNDRVETFSGGMKRRLNLAVSLVHDPKVLLLDEPTVGVDPHSREHLLSIVTHLRDQGTAILYTTHYMEEAERLCDRLGILDSGTIIAMGTLDALVRDGDCGEVVTVRGLSPTLDLASLQRAPGVRRVERSEHGVRLFVKNATAILAPLHHVIGRLDGVHVEIAPLSLETLFLELTGKELRS